MESLFKGDLPSFIIIRLFEKVRGDYSTTSNFRLLALFPIMRLISDFKVFKAFFKNWILVSLIFFKFLYANDLERLPFVFPESFTQSLRIIVRVLSTLLVLHKKFLMLPYFFLTLVWWVIACWRRSFLSLIKEFGFIEILITFWK